MNEARARDMRGEELDAVARCLASAFETDPVTRFLFPEARARARRTPRFYRLVAREIGGMGRVLTADGTPGASIWRAPSPPRPGRISQSWSAVRFISVMGVATVARSREFFEALERAHVREPHWYLAVLGTAPDLQRRGVGSAMLRPVLEECDATDVPAYLESSKPENVSFYQHHGFQLRGEIQVGASPPVWPMLRPPRRRR